MCSCFMPQSAYIERNGTSLYLTLNVGRHVQKGTRKGILHHIMCDLLHRVHVQAKVLAHVSLAISVLLANTNTKLKSRL